MLVLNVLKLNKAEYEGRTRTFGLEDRDATINTNPAKSMLCILL